MEIQGVKQLGRKLFAELDSIEKLETRGTRFHDFMDVTFQLHQWQRESTSSSQKSLKNSYLRFLRGWLFDSNSIEGAVLKGWVESRIGLIPTFHKTKITETQSEGYYSYLVDRMKGSARASAIFSQLDLLYEYVQYELRRGKPESFHLTLFRGIYDLDEHVVIETYRKNKHRIQLNNLNSFTSDFERAWEFGSRVLKVDVPHPKIFFRCGILPKSLLKGEEELLVIGGEFDVQILTGG